MDACIAHARDLLESAKTIRAAGKPHIAYHLCALALEEIGRRELIMLEGMSEGDPVPPAWPSKHSQDHVQKLFWAFFGANFLLRQLTKESIEEMRTVARSIHARRLAGLYVESGAEGLALPNDAVSDEECDGLISLVGSRLEMAASQTRRTDIPDEDRALHNWFLRTADDPERRRYLFSSPSMTKLTEFRDTGVWVRWLKTQFDDAETRAREAVQAEFQRSRDLPSKKTRDKWKMRIRILTQSHSIRPKALNAWNQHCDWLKLIAVSGKRNELNIELILGDNVPAQGLWFFAWGVARSFVTALNIGSIGFWWWRMPEQISRFYESLEDLETKQEFAVERSPSLKVDWGNNRVLTEEDIGRVAMCFAALSGPSQREMQSALDYYIGGITFLSLNDVHWQCEVQAYGNFHESLKAMMRESGEWTDGRPFQETFAQFLGELFPAMEEEERNRFSEISRRFEAKDLQGLALTLKEASFIKLFCDAYFLRSVAPVAVKTMRSSQDLSGAEDDDSSETTSP
jgi:AbiV family abortive infection protein